MRDDEIMNCEQVESLLGITPRTRRKYMKTWMTHHRIPGSSKRLFFKSDIISGLIRIQPGESISQEADEMLRKLRGGE